jgi:uncharacterized protein YodC (DUF2158 family)
MARHGHILEPGAIVMLKSGGPKMTVTKVNKDTVNCVWFDSDGRQHTGEFPIDAIRPGEE